MWHFVQGSKYLSETVSIVLDFSDLFQSGEVIVGTPVVTVTLVSGTDSSPADLLYQGVTVTFNTVVEQRFRLGVEGNIYNVTYQVVTNLGHDFEKSCYLAIVPNEGEAVPNWLSLWETTPLYPYYTGDSMKASHVLSGGRLVQTVYRVPADSIKAGHLLNFGLLTPTNVLSYTVRLDGIQAGHLPISGILLPSNAINYSIPADGTTNRHILISGTLIGAGVSYTIPADGIQVGHLLTGGTLV